MILIALGGNLPSPRHGPPRATLEAALEVLAARGVVTSRRSSWYRSAPVPPSDQPWYVNAVAQVETELAPTPLLATLLATEAEFGRVRGDLGAARVIDLDLLAHGDTVTWNTPSVPGAPDLPHPRLHERAFVLVPLAEIAPDWRHPVLQRSARDLLADLPSGQALTPMPP